MICLSPCLTEKLEPVLCPDCDRCPHLCPGHRLRTFDRRPDPAWKQFDLPAGPRRKHGMAQLLRQLGCEVERPSLGDGPC